MYHDLHDMYTSQEPKLTLYSKSIYSDADHDRAWMYVRSLAT